jgi:hypothetical protein
MRSPLYQTIRRCAFVAALLLGAGWAVVYYTGADRSRSTSRNMSFATPLPQIAPDKSSAGLSAAAIGRLIDGKSEFRRQLSLHEYADSLDTAAMPGAVNEAMQLPLRYRNGALEVLLARWADLDPAAAATYVNLLPASADPEKLRRVIMTAWAEKDFSAALAWTRALEKGAARTQSLTLLAGELAKSDPSRAMQLIERTFVPWQARDAYDKIFSVWAETDFAGALTAAREIPDLQLRSAALRATLVRHVETDVRVVLDFVRNSKDNDLQWGVGSYAAKRWFERDFAAAREYVLALPQGNLRYVQMQQMASAMAQTDPKGALAAVDQLPEKDRSAVTCDILEAWTQKDSAAAIDAARALPEGELRNSAVGRVAQSLVVSDANLAFALVDEIPNGEFHESILSSIASYFADRDPAGAAERYSERASSNERKEVMTQILAKWARSNPDAALEWTAARPDASEFRDVIQYLARESTGNEPEKAISRLEHFPIDVQRVAVAGIAQGWSFSDPEAAANWACELRDEKSKSNAIGALAGEWGNREPAAAARWLESFPVGPDRDVAVENFSQRTVYRDPKGAVAWAMTIQDSSKQAKAMREVFSTWLNRDPSAARNWLQSAGNISGDLQKELQTLQSWKAAE